MTPRIVLDTNIHIAAMVYEDSHVDARVAARAAIKVATTDFQPVMTRETHRELTRIMMRSWYDEKVSRRLRREYVDAQRDQSDYIRLAPNADLPACKDKDDMPFLAAAAQRGAKYLVTLDHKHLGSLGRVNNTLIVSPTQFLLLEGKGAEIGLEDQARIVATDYKPLLVRGHIGSTVFVSSSQAELLKDRDVEFLSPVPVYNPKNNALKRGEPQGFIAVTENPDLQALKVFKDMTVLDPVQYVQMKKLLVLGASSDAPRSPNAPLTTRDVQKFTAGRLLR